MISRLVPLAAFAILLAHGAVRGADADAAAGASSPVEKLVDAMEAEESELAVPLDALRKSYITYLDDLRGKTKSSGDAARLELIAEEMASFRIGRIAPAGEFRELENLQEIYDQQSAKLREKRRLQTVKLLQHYRIAFRQAESELRGKGQFENADSVRTLVAGLEERISKLESQPQPAERIIRIGSRSVPQYAVVSWEDSPLDAGDWDMPLKKNWGIRGPLKDVVDKFKLAITGRLHASDPGEYQFFAVADDSLTLQIDGDEVGSIMTAQTLAPLGTITLERGWHPFLLEFVEGVGGAALELQWSGPGFEKMCPIPARNLAGPAAKNASGR